MNFRFLKPRLINTVLTIITLSLPLLKERVQLLSDGYEVERYIPFHLLFTYLQMRDYFPFIQMIGFSLLVYLAVSVIVSILTKWLCDRKEP